MSSRIETINENSIYIVIISEQTPCACYAAQTYSIIKIYNTYYIASALVIHLSPRNDGLVKSCGGVVPGI